MIATINIITYQLSNCSRSEGPEVKDQLNCLEMEWYWSMDLESLEKVKGYLSRSESWLEGDEVGLPDIGLELALAMK